MGEDYLQVQPFPMVKAQFTFLIMINFIGSTTRENGVWVPDMAMEPLILKMEVSTEVKYFT